MSPGRLEEEDLEVDAWKAELERRGAELESGAVRGVAWEDLRKQLMLGASSFAAIPTA